MGEGPGEVRISFIVTKEERQAFKEVCVRLGVTMSDILRKAVYETIAKNRKIERDKGSQ